MCTLSEVLFFNFQKFRVYPGKAKTKFETKKKHSNCDTDDGQTMDE